MLRRRRVAFANRFSAQLSGSLPAGIEDQGGSSYVFSGFQRGPQSLLRKSITMVGEAKCRAGKVGVKLAVSGMFGQGVGLLVRVVQLVVSLVVLIIVAGILLALLKAHPGNSVVSEVHGWGRWLVGPFNGMFSFRHARVALAVNWGIAAVIYLFAGGLISRFIGRSHNWRPLAGRSSIPNQEVS